MDLKIVLSRTLRWGVTLACIIALAGGVFYLIREGGHPFSLEQYRHFSYEANHPENYTTLHGILGGFVRLTPVGWIQTGVLVLILTPLLRIVISLFDFIRERDWLYAAITAIVLAVILLNSLEGVSLD